VDIYKRGQTETLTQCAQWSKFAVDYFSALWPTLLEVLCNPTFLATATHAHSSKLFIALLLTLWLHTHSQAAVRAMMHVLEQFRYQSFYSLETIKCNLFCAYFCRQIWTSDNGT